MLKKKTRALKRKSLSSGAARTTLAYCGLTPKQIGTLCLGSHIEGVGILMPYTRVEIGPGSESVLVAPINIQCKKTFDFHRESDS